MPDGFMQTTTPHPHGPRLHGPRLHDILQPRLAKRGFVGDIGIDDSLADAGLTSLDLVGLMLAVESEFDIEIPSEMLTPSHFRTLADIESLVVSLQSAA